MNILQDLLMLFEDKADYVAKNFGEKLINTAKGDSSFAGRKNKDFTAEDVVAELVKANPSQKHLVWVARMYVAGHFKMEDLDRMKDELAKFDKFGKKLEKKDLNNYKDLSEFYAAMEKIDPEAEEKAAAAAKLAKELEAAPSKDATWLIRSPDYKALIPKTKEASCKYGAGTRWCTAATGSHNYYDSYAKRGDLIIIMAKIDGKQRKFQFHFESNAFMDENDTPAKKEDIKLLSKHKEHIELIHKLIDIYHPEED